MRPRILVVEDDEATLTMLHTMLTDWGYDVVGAMTGPSAITSIRDNCPDVVISDLVMPGMSGLDLLQAIRAMKECSVVFFLLTGQCSVGDAVRAICEGADECLLKPFRPEVLRALLVDRGFAGEPAAAG